MESEAKLEALIAEVERLNDAGGAAAAQRAAAVAQMFSCAARVASLQTPPPLRPSTPSARASAAQTWLLRGRIAAAVAARGGAAEAEAGAALATAVRLQPALSAAWNLLGEIACRRGDLRAAKLCLARAADCAGADRSARARALRALSMVLRQLAAAARCCSCGDAAPLELAAMEDEGLRCAREAVALDVAAGESWFVLGNALVSKALSVGASVDELRGSALKAYDRAVQCGFSSPDLHFNRAAALSYCFDNDRACEENWKAHELDPEWDAPLKECARIGQLIERVSSLLARKRAKSAAKLLPPTTPLEKRSELLVDVVGIASAANEVPLALVVDDGGGPSGGRAVLCLFGVSQKAVHPGDVIELTSGFSVEQAGVCWRRPHALSFPLILASYPQVSTINGARLQASAYVAPVATMSQQTTSLQ